MAKKKTKTLAEVFADPPDLKDRTIETQHRALMSVTKERDALKQEIVLVTDERDIAQQDLSDSKVEIGRLERSLQAERESRVGMGRDFSKLVAEMDTMRARTVEAERGLIHSEENLRREQAQVEVLRIKVDRLARVIRGLRDALAAALEGA